MKLLFTLFGLFLGHLAFGQNTSFIRQPSLIKATSSSIELDWNIDSETDSLFVLWGLQPTELSNRQVLENNKEKVAIPDLQPATVYYAKVQYNIQGQSYFSETKSYITSSLSTGEMKVYFNFPVDQSYSNGSSPATTSTSGLESSMVNYILAAKNTIDICMYNDNRDVYIDALNQAADNGVTVRYIAESANSNSSLHNNVLNFPVLYADASGIMHNKFLIIDKETTDDAVVVTGAYNFTNSNLFQGYNNMISIRDQALAEIYTIEFEEMWGGSGAQYNLNTSKIGDEKTDNTPHTLFINGIKVESYFSPSDQTTARMINAINTTDYDLRFALLGFTNNQLENTVLNLNLPVKGLIEEMYTGTILAQFQANGQAIYDYEESGRFLHHKYGLIDAEHPDSNPTVITGSHNWSYSAENYNDENTLIIHDADIVNIFLQEFEARWKIIVAIEEINGESKIEVFPNPASDALYLSNNTTSEQTVSIIDCLGNRMNVSVLRPNESKTIDIQHIPQGVYYLLLHSDTGSVSSEKLVIHHE